MRFTFRQASSGSERLGVLTGFVETPSAVLETPTCALLTQGGSVVHLTAEVLSKVFNNSRLLWVPLSNSLNLEAGVKAHNKGVAAFAGIQEHVACVTLNNMNEVTPTGHFESDRVPLWTKQGKKMITAEQYMDVMEIFKPNIIFAVADSRTSLNEGSKRLAKSSERTCNMLETCVSRYKGSKVLRYCSSLVGVIVAPGDEKRCNDCISRVLSHKDTLVGVALSGLTDGNEDNRSVTVDSLKSIFRRVGDAIPKDLVRFVEGCWSPSVMLAAIEHGWDVLDGSYAVKLTDAGHALALNFDVDATCDEPCVLDLIDERCMAKAIERASKAKGLSNVQNRLGGFCVIAEQINSWRSNHAIRPIVVARLERAGRYKDDFTPILKGCECLACTKHTRAYIRHLLNTREMLAQVLLSIHNLHHFDQLFHHARIHIAADTFQSYKTHITTQFDKYTPEINPKAEQTNEITVKDSAVKKKRVSEAINGRR